MLRFRNVIQTEELELNFTTMKIFLNHFDWRINCMKSHRNDFTARNHFKLQHSQNNLPELTLKKLSKWMVEMGRRGGWGRREVEVQNV